MRDNESDESDNAGKATAEAVVKEEAIKRILFARVTLSPSCWAWSSPNCKRLRAMTAENQNTETDEEIRKHGKDGSPVILGGAAEKPASARRTSLVERIIRK